MTAPIEPPFDDPKIEWLMQRRQHFDELVGGVRDYAIFVMSVDGLILDWNQGAALLKGYSSDEIIGRSFSIFYSESEQRAGIPQEELEVATAHGSFVTEGWRQRKNGGRFWASVTITAIKMPNGEVAGFLKITRDLTDQQLRTMELRQSEERMRLLIESVTEYAIFMLDPHGTIVSWNPGARRIKQYDAQEIIGEHFSRFYSAQARDEGIPDRLLAQALAHGSAEDEGWRVKKTGEIFWASVVITALYDDLGEHCGFVKITRDLTERRQSADVARDSERKDVFLATLAHELRNPLAPLAPALEILLRSPHDADRVVQVAAMMRRQVDQMSRLIEDLVDLSRITTGKISLRLASVAVVEIIESALDSVKPLIDERGHRLTLNLPPVPVNVIADKHRLTQALSNLLTNAARYTERPGEIVVSVEVEEPSSLLVSVRDTGRGIPASRLHDIFDLFTQGAKGTNEGLGIGLTLVKTIAELHEGSVTAVSEGEGKGSEFILHLPVIEPSDRLRSKVEKTSAAKKCRILIVDDAKPTADTLALFLEMEGFQPLVAYTGEQAVEMASREKPDVCCMDVGLPGIDGNEAARRIRKLLPNVVLIAITGLGSRNDRQRTSEAGFDHHLVKPLRPNDLRAVLRDKAAHCFTP